MSGKLKDALQKAWRAERKISFYGFSGLSESYSYSDFGRRVEEFEAGLKELGAGPGKVVAVMASTGVELTQVCAAVWSIGATLTVLPTPTRLANLEQFLGETTEKLRRSRAAVLVGEGEVVSAFREFAGIPVLSFQQLLDRKGCGSFEDAGLPHPFPALIQFSSGTTRDPQPIMLGEDALLRNARAVLDRFPGGASHHSCVSWLPLYHDMGLIGCFLMPLLAPGDLTLMRPEVFAVRPFTWLQAISEQRATTSSAPNFALAHCVDRISDEKLESLDLSCWSIAMVGAETVRPATLRRFAHKFARAGFSEQAFTPVYGLAEATLAVTFSSLGEGMKTYRFDPLELAASGRVVRGARETVSLGRPLPGVEVEIREHGTVLGEGRLGEVWVKSPSLLSGVLGEGASPLEKGWLPTGDAGFLKDGELYLYGRRRDILLLDGRNHDPGTLEEAAETVTGLKRCCAFTLETGEERDRLVLLCEVSPRFKGEPLALADKIRTACRLKTTLVPDVVELLRVGELPVTSSGKLRRGEASKMYESGELQRAQVAPV